MINNDFVRTVLLDTQTIHCKYYRFQQDILTGMDQIIVHVHDRKHGNGLKELSINQYTHN